MPGSNCIAANDALPMVKNGLSKSHGKLVSNISSSISFNSNNINSRLPNNKSRDVLTSSDHSSNPLSPPEYLAKGRCFVCGSSKKIELVIEKSTHPSIKGASFCSYSCFTRYSFNLKIRPSQPLDSAISVESSHFNFNKTNEICYNCKLTVRGTLTRDSTGLRGFCSLECYQKFRLKQGYKSKVTNSSPKITPQAKNHLASRSDLSNTEDAKSSIEQSQQVSSPLREKKVIKGTNPPALLALYAEKETNQLEIRQTPSLSPQVIDKDQTVRSTDSANDSSLKVKKLNSSSSNNSHSKKMSKVTSSKASSFNSAQSSSSPSVNSTHHDPLSPASNTPSRNNNSSSNNSNQVANSLGMGKKQPPSFHYETFSVFDWDAYLDEVGGEPAPESYFAQSVDPPANEFAVGMKLEAPDPRNTSSICIATVVALFGSRIQLRLDGSDDQNDFWELVDSNNIFPIGYCEEHGGLLQPPLGFRKNTSQWPLFLVNALRDASIAPKNCFKSPPPSPKKNYFQVGMKLEAIDRKHPRLICPATVGAINGNRVFVTFDGWKGAFDYWCEYSTRDIFPVGWCQKSGHPLQPPGDKVPTLQSTAKRMSGAKNNSSVNSNSANSTPKTDRTNSTSKSNSSNNASHSTNSVKKPIVSSHVAPKETTPNDASNGHIYRVVKDTSKNSSHKSNLNADSNGESVKSNLVSTKEPQALTSADKKSVSVKLQKVTVTNSSSPNSSNHGNGEQSSYHPPKSSSSTADSSASAVVKQTKSTSSLKRTHEQIDDQASTQFKSEPVALKKPAPTANNNNNNNNTCDQSDTTLHHAAASSSSNTKAKQVSNDNSHCHSSTSSSSKSPSSSSSSSDRFSTDPEEWDSNQVVDYMLSIDQSLSVHSNAFISNEIDGKAFLLLTSDMLIKFMGLKLGPALKIWNIIGRLKQKKRNQSNH